MRMTKDGIEAVLTGPSNPQISDLCLVLEYLSEEALGMGLPLTANLIGAASNSIGSTENADHKWRNE